MPFAVTVIPARAVEQGAKVNLLHVFFIISARLSCDLVFCYNVAEIGEYCEDILHTGDILCL